MSSVEDFLSYAPGQGSLPRSAVRSASARLQGPDLLRAGAILLVMLLHTRGEAAPGLLSAVRPYAWLGVDIFFVLSGYLIGTQLIGRVTVGRRVSLTAFYLNRAFRILPAYFLVLGAYFIVPSIREAPDLPPLWRYLTFSLNFGLDYTGAFTHAWSLCVEEHFYLLFPLAVMVLVKFGRPRTTLPLAVLVLVAGMILRIALWKHWMAPVLTSGADDDLMSTYMRVIYYPSYTRADGLLIGVGLAAIRIFHAGWWADVMPAKRALIFGLLTTVSAIALIGYRGEMKADDAPIVVQTLLGVALSFPLFALGIALVLSALIDFEPTLARYPVPGVGTVAAISYSLYLTHKAVMHVDRQILGEANLTGLPGLLVYFGTSLGIAWLLGRFVEQPFLAMRSRVVSGR